jgi:hypothetical protein
MQKSFAEEEGDGGLGGGDGGGIQRSPQVAALGGWLLDVAGALLDPTDTDRPSAVAVPVLTGPTLQKRGGGVSWCSTNMGGRAACADSDALGVTWRRVLSARQRFAYFERKVGIPSADSQPSRFTGISLKDMSSGTGSGRVLLLRSRSASRVAKGSQSYESLCARQT